MSDVIINLGKGEFAHVNNPTLWELGFTVDRLQTALRERAPMPKVAEAGMVLKDLTRKLSAETDAMLRAAQLMRPAGKGKK